jgi:hypothetical protein
MKKFLFPMAQLTFKPSLLFFFVGNDAMNSPRYWHLRDDACNAAMNIMAALAIRILISNSCTRWQKIFKGTVA